MVRISFLGRTDRARAMSRRVGSVGAVLLVSAVLATSSSAVTAQAAAADRFPATVPLPDRSLPEGITGGPGSSFFAGSREDGSIYRGSLRTGAGAVLVPGEPGAVAVGLQFHKPSGLLWVAGGATGTVTAYDSATGATVARYVVPAGVTPRFLNDVEVTTNGVYVTDSRNAELVVVRTGSGAGLPDEVELLPLTGDWAQDAGPDPARPANNANGIRSLPGGDVLIVSQGKLLRVDVRTGVADLLEQTGGDALTGGDGLELRGSALYVVYGFGRDSVAVVELAGDARSYAVTGELLDEDLERPTTATYAAGSLWVVNGKFTTQPTPTTYEVVRVTVPTSQG